MNNVNYDEFVGVINRASQQESTYITFQENHYSSVHNKRAKNLSSTQINTLFSRAAEHYANDVEKLATLKTAIDRFNTRLKNSRPWYFYVFCCFCGMKPSRERELLRVKGRVEAAITRNGGGLYVPPVVPKASPAPVPPPETISQEMERKLAEQVRIIDAKLQFDPENSTHHAQRIKLLSMKLFDSLDLKLEHSGEKQSYGIKTYLDDLIAFRRIKSDDLSEHELGIINRTIEELRFAFEISILRAIYEDKNYSAEKKEKILDYINGRIRKAIADLKTGECVVIPGGYSYQESEKVNKGHSVLEVFRKERDGTLTFTIVNTGEGAKGPGMTKELSAETISAVKETFEMAKKLFKKSRINSHGRDKPVQDIRFKNIAVEGLNDDFLNYLITSNSTAKNMKEVNAEIRNKLERIGDEAKGREHKAQNNGSCSTKSVTSFLNERLENRLYRKFKHFFTEAEVKRIPQYKVDEKAKKSLSYFGQYMIEKRANKLKKAK